MKRFYFGLILACLTSVSQAADVSGLQSTPQLNERGELTVTLMNWSKLELVATNITATLADDSGKPCKWTLATATTVPPTQNQTVVLADSAAVKSCLREHKSLATAEISMLRFAALAPKAKRTASTSTITIETDIVHGNRTMRGSSAWSLAHIKK